MDIAGDGKIRNTAIKTALNDIISTYQAKIVPIRPKIASMDAEEIAKFLKNDVRNFDANDFFAYSQIYISRKKESGAVSSAKNYEYAVNSVRKFWKAKSLFFSDVTVTWLEDYKSYLLCTAKKTNRINAGSRIVSLYMGALRTIFNAARREYGNVIPYPFKNVVIKQSVQVVNKGLTSAQIRSIIKLQNLEEVGRKQFIGIARDVFILSFYLCGINAIDMFYLEKSNYQDGIITYCRRKTKNMRADNALISIKVEAEAKVIIDKYLCTSEKKTDKRLFNFGDRWKNDDTFSKSINLGLKIISRKIGVSRLIYYQARHSWASIARNECKIDKYTVHQGLNHSDQATKIDDIYINKDFTNIWHANRQVIDLVNEINPQFKLLTQEREGMYVVVLVAKDLRGSKQVINTQIKGISAIDVYSKACELLPVGVIAPNPTSEEFMFNYLG